MPTQAVVLRRVPSVTGHGFGCICTECAMRAVRNLDEVRRVREHNARAFAGPRSPAPSRPGVPGRAGDMHYRFDWMGCPKPGELDYLRGL